MFILVLIFINDIAYGYLDPGSGSLIIQVLIAGLIGLSYTIKVYWRKIVYYLSTRLNLKSKKDLVDDE